jgi:peptide chain release factor 1
MLKDTLRTKLERLAERLDEIHALLAEPVVIGNPQRFRELAKEQAEIKPVIDCFREYLKSAEAVAGARAMLEDADPAIRELAAEELKQAETEQAGLEARLRMLLLPRDPADNSNIYLEIRAGTGGEEAALFAADLMRMYLRYAETRGWKTELVSSAPSERGGYREVIVRVIGQGAYSRLKFESGAHRVQRVPETEAQGRIHTSTCTVAVLPELDEIENIEISPNELRIDTYRASGAGGQHVNKTDSAIRITHLPTGLVVECQEERSQHKNRARAMALLRTKLLNAERDRLTAEQSATRRLLVGTGERSERIRTYNFPQGRVTDHRINLTLYQLEQVLEGKLDPVIDALVSEYQAEQLAAVGT